MKQTKLLSFTAALLSAAIIALNLAGCGGSDAKDSTTDGRVSVTAEQTTVITTTPQMTTKEPPVTDAQTGTNKPSDTPEVSTEPGTPDVTDPPPVTDPPVVTDPPTTSKTTTTTGRPTTPKTETTTTAPVTDKPVTTAPPAIDTPDTSDTRLDIVVDKKSDYTIIYPAGTISATLSAYLTLRSKIVSAIGYSFTMNQDTKAAGEYEILIGLTNRPASKEAYAKLKENQFSFSLSGKTVVIAAYDDACMKLAIETFVENYTGDGRLSLDIEDFPVTYACGERYNTVTVDNTRNIGGNDPYVIKHGGYYYYCWSENGVKVAKIDNLNNISTANGNQVFTASQGNFYQVWAPELHYIDGEWYIYVAMCQGADDNARHRMYCLKGTSQDPTDPFVLMGQVTDPLNKWAIDGTVFKYNGELYTIWSGWQGDTDSGQYLYLAHMSNPWTIDSERVQISSFPLLTGWDKPLFSTTKIHEGPCVVVVGNTIYVLFSANGSWTDDYSIGYLKFSGGDIMKASSWTKSSSALLSKSNQNYGPGHCSVVQADDGRYYMIYHANLNSGTGWGGRSVRVQEIIITETSIRLASSDPLQTELKILEKYVIGKVE